MTPVESIRSASNPRVKRVRAALRGKEPDVLVLEGDRLFDEALRRGLRPELVLVSERRAERAGELARRGLAVCLVEDGLMASLSAMTSSPGLLGLVAAPARRGFGDLEPGPDALVVVVAGVQDPGNLGALARTAEAAGASALAVLPGGCRPWNEKALRGSMGSLLRLPVLEPRDAAEAIEGASAVGFRHVFARSRGGVPPDRFHWAGRVALWVSAESGELPPEACALAERAEGVTIPLAAGVESLNVTAAAAVLLFAAGRAYTPEWP